MMLFLFLTSSVGHFGEGDLSLGSAGTTAPTFSATPYKRTHMLALQTVEAVARGGMFFLAISRHSEICQDIFQVIIAGNQSDIDVKILMGWLQIGCVVHLCACAATVIYHAAQRTWESAAILVEMLTIASLFYHAPPLMAFAVYFNAFHALRHMLRVVVHSTAPQEGQEGHGDTGGARRRKKNLVSYAGVGVKFTGFALCLLTLLYWCIAPHVEVELKSGWGSVSSSFYNLQQDRIARDSILRVIFMALSIVTSPHMVNLHSSSLQYHHSP
jgi:Brp/Blh family beta-carotene 15,15'-monooxygenase